PTSATSTPSLHDALPILEKDVPALIIEPAKDDYVRWAIKMNEQLPKEKQFRIYMPGYDSFEGTPLQSLHLCPFEPAAVPGAMVRSEEHTSELQSRFDLVC